MYLPAHFREDRRDVQHDLMRACPLGTLFTAGPHGPLANHVPFLLYADEGPHGVLRAHMARANDQLDELRAVAECFVVFQGPEDYITPSWYATKRETGKVVPTWNFVAVHVWGAPRVIEDPLWLRRQLEDLTNHHEHPRPRPWHVDDAPPDFIAAQMRGIVGLELPIARIEGKWKVSQNRSEADRQGVADGLRAQGPASAAMAALVREKTPPG
jgi:transcriptional regulator